MKWKYEVKNTQTEISHLTLAHFRIELNNTVNKYIVLAQLELNINIATKIERPCN